MAGCLAVPMLLPDYILSNEQLYFGHICLIKSVSLNLQGDTASMSPWSKLKLLPHLGYKICGRQQLMIEKFAARFLGDSRPKREKFCCNNSYGPFVCTWYSVSANPSAEYYPSFYKRLKKCYWWSSKSEPIGEQAYRNHCYINQQTYVTIDKERTKW